MYRRCRRVARRTDTNTPWSFSGRSGLRCCQTYGCTHLAVVAAAMKRHRSQSRGFRVRLLAASLCFSGFSNLCSIRLYFDVSHYAPNCATRFSRCLRIHMRLSRLSWSVQVMTGARVYTVLEALIPQICLLCCAQQISTCRAASLAISLLTPSFLSYLRPTASMASRRSVVNVQVEVLSSLCILSTSRSLCFLSLFQRAKSSTHLAWTLLVAAILLNSSSPNSSRRSVAWSRMQMSMVRFYFSQIRVCVQIAAD